MASTIGVTQATVTETTAREVAVYREGIRAGLLGAATIAAWFLLLDSIAGRPFFTPTVLGTTFFRGADALAPAEGLAPSLDMVVAFTFVHVLAFLLIGFVVARLLALAEQDASLGFGVVILVVLLQFGFFGACMVFAEPVLGMLAWPAVMMGNLLAASAMGITFWRRHPHLTVDP